MDVRSKCRGIKRLTLVYTRSFHLLHLLFDDYVIHLIDVLHSELQAKEMLRNVSCEFPPELDAHWEMISVQSSSIQQRRPDASVCAGFGGVVRDTGLDKFSFCHKGVDTDDTMSCDPSRDGTTLYSDYSQLENVADDAQDIPEMNHQGAVVLDYQNHVEPYTTYENDSDCRNGYKISGRSCMFPVFNQWLAIEDVVRSRVSDVGFKKRAVIEGKLSKLLLDKETAHAKENSTVTSALPNFHDRVLNLSKHRFGDSEMDLLSKGLNFAPHLPVTKRDIQLLAVDCEIALHRKSPLIQHQVADLLSLHSNDSAFVSHNRQHSMVLRSINENIQKNNLVIQKADKGNCVVILNKSDYLSKCSDFIEKAKLKVLPKDPTRLFQNAVKKAVRECNLFSQGEITKLTYMNLMPPRLYDLPKIHKKDHPIRPVVSGIGALTHKLASKLTLLISSLLKVKPTHTIKNSMDLVQKIKNFKVPHSTKLVSFDVIDLFTSIPPEEAQKIHAVDSEDMTENETIPSKPRDERSMRYTNSTVLYYNSNDCNFGICSQHVSSHHDHDELTTAGAYYHDHSGLMQSISANIYHSYAPNSSFHYNRRLTF
ncbi:hypothetical protein J437_LFUL015426 [Ladona fulva]|uniref:Uncharacterized protein n=1 Tax=Ladona fulva TaxID=123851 RepID=A0A8K0KK57_LADFU|nr:hypothetical protein J437_LFUL015426 [Ladona fulva]